LIIILMAHSEYVYKLRLDCHVRVMLTYVLVARTIVVIFIFCLHIKFHYPYSIICCIHVRMNL
jgi:hypothetical protein